MTLKEIAAQAGVSTATVSYVLNGSARVSEETRRRIEKIVKDTGYRTNILAQQDFPDRGGCRRCDGVAYGVCD